MSFLKKKQKKLICYTASFLQSVQFESIRELLFSSLSAEIFTVFEHKGAWVAVLLGTLLRVQHYQISM